MKFCGNVGYAVTQDQGDGIWLAKITEHQYYGDVTRTSKRNENSTSVNDNITVSNTISIVADAFAYQNFFAIQYVNWMGTNWRVSYVEVQRPRLILTLGGVWNGEQS